MILHPAGRFDNAPADNREIEVRPLAAAMGAEIVGARLASLSDAQFSEVRAALFRGSAYASGRSRLTPTPRASRAIPMSTR
jgi:hypothetical protein